MESPRIAAKSPVKVVLEPGKYFWCACGRSQDQPFCDGSHKGTGHAPVLLKIDEKEEVYLCRCKQSSNKPYCDGTHKTV